MDNKKSFSTSIKFGTYRTFLKNLTEDQKNIIKSIGFGGLLHFNCTEAPRTVAYLLATRFDVATRTVKFQNGSSFELNPFVVHQILRVPLGGRRIRQFASKSEKETIGNDTGTSTVAPTVDQLLNLVTRELTGDKFARIFVLISMSIFLCPTSYGSASKHYYSAVASVGDILNYDWCSFILEWLVNGIQKFQNSNAKANAAGKEKTSSLCGCFLLLVVTYFEYIRAPHIVLREDVPRIKIWDDHMIQEYLALEGNSGDFTSFGLLELKEPAETPFVVASVSSSSFARLPAQVESFIQNLTSHNDQSNVRSQIRDMCSKFHKEIMTASLAAIQPVVSRQLCSMAEFMWDVSHNHGAAGTYVQMERHSTAGTSDQRDRATHTKVDQGITARSRSRKAKAMPQVDVVMSSAPKKIKSKGASASKIKKSRNKVEEAAKSRSKVEEAAKSNEISTENTMDVTKSPSINEKDHELPEIHADNQTNKLLHTGQEKTTMENAMDITKSPSNNEKDDELTEIHVDKQTDKQLDTGHQKTTSQGANFVAHVNASPTNIPNLVMEPAQHEDQCTINTEHSKREGIVNDGNGKSATLEDHHATDAGGRKSISGSTSLGAQPYSTNMILSTSVYESHIKTDIKGKHQPDSAVGPTTYMVDEVVPDSFEGAEALPTKQKRRVIVSDFKHDIEAGSGSNKPPKKLRIGLEEMVDSKEVTPYYVVDDPDTDVSQKNSTRKPTTPTVDDSPSKSEEPVNVPLNDTSQMKEQIRWTWSDLNINVPPSDTSQMKEQTRWSDLSSESRERYKWIFIQYASNPKGALKVSKNHPPIVGVPPEILDACVKHVAYVAEYKAYLDQAEAASKMHTRKRALKRPKDLSTPSSFFNIPHKKTESEIALYNTVTKRLTKNDAQASETIVQIGRYHVDATLFGDSFRRRHRVGTFVMNVFCEALNADYKANPDLKPSKCFLTSDVVDKLCTQTFEVSAYNSYLSSRVIGFSINKFNMVSMDHVSSFLFLPIIVQFNTFFKSMPQVMIPVCKFEHWWLIVANIRDNRFDILNSLEMDGTTSKMTNEICDNFRKLYRHNFGKVFDKLSLPIQVQPAPQQKTGFDCGIYVMKFMELWDGRKLHLHDLSMEDTNTYRQKIANYILRHPKNLKTTAAVKKFISSDT